MATAQFVDAQQMRVAYPDTFQVPTAEELNVVKAGDSVKVCVHSERFWVSVLRVEGEKVFGTVDNDLLLTDLHGLKYDDRIEFEKRHIYMVMD